MEYITKEESKHALPLLRGGRVRLGYHIGLVDKHYRSVDSSQCDGQHVTLTHEWE